MKKIYMKPLIKAAELDTDIICGSGRDTENLRLGSNPNEDYDPPTTTTKWGQTGFFGE